MSGSTGREQYMYVLLSHIFPFTIPIQSSGFWDEISEDFGTESFRKNSWNS